MVEKITNTQIEIISIFNNNYLNKFHTRKIAKLIKKDHSSIIPHLKYLVKENILEYELIGKNKNYFLKLSNILTKDYIIISEIYRKNMLLNKIFLIKKLTHEINNLKLTDPIVLFGSYANETYNNKSDIDLLYIGKLSEKTLSKIENIGKIYGKEINIKNLTLKSFENQLRSKDNLIIEILNNHIVLQNVEIFVDALWWFFNERA